MARFNFTPTENEDGEYFEVSFKGEMIGLTDFEAEPFQKLAKRIREEAESRIVVLDLRQITMWDSEGMRQILLYLGDALNVQHGNRIHIIAPLDGYLFNRAKEKYKHIVNVTVPWFASKDSLPGI